MFMEMGSGAGSGLKNVVVIGPQTQSHYDVMAVPLLNFALSQIAVRHLRVTDAAVAAGVCLTNFRVERPFRIFQPAFSAIAPYLGVGVARAYASHVLTKAGIAYASGPAKWPPVVTLIQRGQHSRYLKDADYLAQAFSEAHVAVEVVQLESLGPREQLAKVAATDILIGVHGAGLTHCIYQRPGALVVQLRPKDLSWWDGNLFHRMALLADVNYYDWPEMDNTFTAPNGGLPAQTDGGSSP
jgi:hypothetical protein